MGTIGFTYSTTYTCRTLSDSLASYCLDLQFLGVEKIICSEDLQELCNDWHQVAARELFWSSFLGFICHFYLVGSIAYAMQQRRSIPSILAQYRKWAPGEVVNGALKSDSPHKLKKEDSASNVRFTLPGRDRPESPIMFDDPEPIATRSLMSGMSNESTGRPAFFSMFWGDENDLIEDEEDDDDFEEAEEGKFEEEDN
jgi:hypothetical protein